MYIYIHSPPSLILGEEVRRDDRSSEYVTTIVSWDSPSSAVGSYFNMYIAAHMHVGKGTICTCRFALVHYCTLKFM